MPPNSRPNRTMLRRALFLLAACGIAAFAVLMLQLFRLQILRHDELESAALQQQLKAAVQQEDGFTLDALLQLNEYMVSDCTVDQLSDLGDSLAAYQVGDILTTPGDAQEGEEFMEFTVDEAALQQLVMDVFYEPVEES